MPRGCLFWVQPGSQARAPAGREDMARLPTAMAAGTSRYYGTHQRKTVPEVAQNVEMRRFCVAEYHPVAEQASSLLDVIVDGAVGKQHASTDTEGDANWRVEDGVGLI